MFIYRSIYCTFHQLKVRDTYLLKLTVLKDVQNYAMAKHSLAAPVWIICAAAVTGYTMAYCGSRLSDSKTKVNTTPRLHIKTLEYS
jgi:type VI protein secretion system component VasF